MNTENKNTELDNTDKKLHISDVMCCFCGKLHQQTEFIDDQPICSTCYDAGYNFDFRNWLTIEKLAFK